MALRALIGRLIALFPTVLARFGLVDRRKGTEALDLAAPVMVSGALRVALRLADYLMVGVALGQTAIAGLELGFQYFFIGFGLALAVTSGTISVVSRLKGADEHARADLAVKQSLWLSILLSAPLMGISWVYAEEMIALLNADPAVIQQGSAYLRIIMLALVFRFWNMVAARALAGGADTRTPMYVRLLTLPTNIVLNAVLIFGIGPFPQLGIAGAALGTLLATILAAVMFLALLLTDRFSVRLRLGGPHLDRELLGEIVRVASPLAGMRMLETFGRFPFLFILGVIGTPAVAAFGIARQVVLTAMMPAWGYATAASTLVGQAIGRGEERESTEYGWQTLRIALATQVPVALVIGIAAEPIALSFGMEDVGLAVDFIRVFALAVVGFSISRTMRGSLRGAGDTSWPFYGMLVSTYVVRLPIAALALPAGYALTVAGLSIPIGLGLGMPAIFLALFGDFYVRAVVNVVRFRSGRWRAIARSSVDGG
ncbi:MATE family efflux transporter [Halorhabdus rudnickae]|uniref:MATE family efflux transporter n=1 Tax=Halorhabdus rudnickae TaxID=1775544 RepID=UPI0010827661|nr:MATE family efflux transporter [Halorhabdus rudnickae]